MLLHNVTTDEPSYYCIDLEWGNLGATRQWFSCYLHYISNFIVNFNIKIYSLCQRTTREMC